MIQLLHNLWRQRRGTAAVEFAFALPALIVMFMGVFEVSQALIVYMKVIDVADTVSDLVAQEKQVASSDINNYYIAGQLVMTPSAGAGLGLAVASVIFAAPNPPPPGCTTGSPCVAWSVTRGTGSTMTNAQAITLATTPNPLGDTGAGSEDSVIVAQASYTYNSALSYLIQQGIKMSATVFSRPRAVFTIPCTAPCT